MTGTTMNEFQPRNYLKNIETCKSYMQALINDAHGIPDDTFLYGVSECLIAQPDILEKVHDELGTASTDQLLQLIEKVETATVHMIIVIMKHFELKLRVKLS